MAQIEMKNAKIKSTQLGGYDGGPRPLTFWLFLEYGEGGEQGAGGLGLAGNERTGELISRILEVVGVNKWEDLPGKYIRVRASYHKVNAIGHIVKDEWLDFNEFFAREAE